MGILGGKLLGTSTIGFGYFGNLLELSRGNGKICYRKPVLEPAQKSKRLAERALLAMWSGCAQSWSNQRGRAVISARGAWTKGLMAEGAVPAVSVVRVSNAERRPGWASTMADRG